MLLNINCIYRSKANAIGKADGFRRQSAINKALYIGYIYKDLFIFINMNTVYNL